MVLHQVEEFSCESQKCRLGRAALRIFAISRVGKTPAVTQTHQVPARMGGSQKASSENDPQCEFNLSISRRVQDQDSEEFDMRQTVYFYQNHGRNSADSKWQGDGVIIGRFGRKFVLPYYRTNPIDVYLDDLRVAGKIFDLLGCGGAQHLH